MSVAPNLPFRPANSAVSARQVPDPAHRNGGDEAPLSASRNMTESVKRGLRVASDALQQLHLSPGGRDAPLTNGHTEQPLSDPPILRLSNEMLLLILDHVEADPEKAITVDNRLYLSRESFSFPHPPHPDQEEAIGNFRRVCRRFSELGAARQFARVTTRFSQKGFKRLEEIAGQRHLARCVKKFSYMVPYFYSIGITNISSIRSLRPASQALTLYRSCTHWGSPSKSQRQRS